MLPALCRFLHRVFDHHRTDWASHPLDAEADWQRVKAEHPVTFLHDEREPHLESDRRVNETYYVPVFDFVERRVRRWRPGDPL